MTRAVISRPSSSVAHASLPLPGGYLKRSELPLNSLLFVLPLIILYEIGTRIYTSDPLHQTEQRIIAFTLMQRFFALFGASGRYLPALAVVGILLTWHIARNDPWTFRGRTLLMMGFESIMAGFPVILLSFLTAHYLPLATGRAGWQGLIVLSLGAGIYEELVFRFILFTLLSLLLLDFLKLPKMVSMVLIVLVSAILFSLYHYLGNEAFQARSFIFRTLAGIYFGVVFLIRGFGITAGCHASYDVMIVAWATLS